jgi:hypothetical protein
VAAAGKKLLSRTMYTAEWRLEGEIEVGEEVRPGTWLVRVPRKNPLRLLHATTGRMLVVPFAEMETDFASVPRLAQKAGRAFDALHLERRAYEKSAFFHDALYCAQWCWAVQDGVAVRVAVSKAEADSVLFVGLECEGATLADGLAYTGAVALFGAGHWEAAGKEAGKWPALFEEKPGNLEGLESLESLEGEGAEK